MYGVFWDITVICINKMTSFKQLIFIRNPMVQEYVTK